jgi:DNA-binding GntR family transcriptional regulator
MNEIFKINDYELLSKKVYRILKKRIIKGDLKPGTKLLEAKIAEQLGVSRTPVRESLRELAAEGFVKMSPNLGMIVIEFFLEDFCEVLQIRRVLEGLAGSIAAKKISKEEIEKLEEIIEQMSISIIKDDMSTYSELNGEFHNLILNVCGNKRLMKICANLSGSEHRFRIRSLSIPGRLKYSLEEHKNIVKALKRGDSIETERLSQVHIRNVLKNILAYGGKEEN